MAGQKRPQIAIEAMLDRCYAIHLALLNVRAWYGDFFFVLNRLGTGMMVLRRDLSSMEVELDIEGLIDVLLRFDLFFLLGLDL